MRTALLSVLLAVTWLSAADSIDGTATLQGLRLGILPLGDSITFGSHSSHGNGYRQQVHDTLAKRNAVTMIGSVHTGSMADNAHEGHPGWTILDIYGQAGQNFDAAPNVVLFMAGINNIIQDLNASTAHELVSESTDRLLEHLPEAVVLVGNLTPVGDSTLEVQRVAFNQQLAPLLDEKRQAGKKVLGVNMDVLDLGVDMISDGIHPNDAGYAKMAQSWLEALDQVNAMGWIRNRMVAPSIVDQESIG